MSLVVSRECCVVCCSCSFAAVVALAAALEIQLAVALGFAALFACALAGVHPPTAMKVVSLENADRDL